jgi:hypothetical protein
VRFGVEKATGSLITRVFKEMKMKKKGILLATVILFVAVGLVQAQGDAVGVTLDATWTSKYIWRGFDLLDDKGAFQPSVDVDLFDSGFSINVWASYPTSSGTMNKGTAGTASSVDATEYDYTLAYDTVLCEGEDWATTIRAQGIYYDFIDRPDEAADAQEVGVQVAWPNLCPTGVITPSYYVGKIWPAAGNAGTNSAGVAKPDLTTNYGGWIHIFGVSYDLKVPGLTANTPEQVFTFSAAAIYNDGFTDGVLGTPVDHDWSHALFGVTTEIELAENVSLTPSFYYQSSWDDSVNPEDEVWASIGATCRF